MWGQRILKDVRERRRMYTWFWSENLEEENNLESKYVAKIILKSILEEQDGD
jgi:hypothetical protein